MAGFKVKRKGDLRVPGLYDYVEHPEYGAGMVCNFDVKTQKSRVAFGAMNRVIGVDWKELTITSRWMDRLKED